MIRNHAVKESKFDANSESGFFLRFMSRFSAIWSVAKLKVVLQARITGPILLLCSAKVLYDEMRFYHIALEAGPVIQSSLLGVSVPILRGY